MDPSTCECSLPDAMPTSGPSGGPLSSAPMWSPVTVERMTTLPAAIIDDVAALAGTYDVEGDLGFICAEGPW
jgi:hypothetical protein